MNYEIIFILTGIMLFSYWFNYIIGGPLSTNPKDINETAILFSFPYWLAKRRITPGYRATMKTHFFEELNITKDYFEKVKLNRQYEVDVLLRAREIFTWEKSILCPICFHWWLSVIAGIILLCDGHVTGMSQISFGFFIYLVNHLIIRKIS